MRFEEKYSKFKPLVDEGLIKEIYYNDKESICRFGNSYALFNYRLNEMCTYVFDLGDLYTLAQNPMLIFDFHKQKRLSGFKMTEKAIEAIRQNARQTAPSFNADFESALGELFKQQQSQIENSNGMGGR